jgi:hypothetical protein
LLARCNYTEAIWNLIANLFNLHGYSQISLSGGGGGLLKGLKPMLSKEQGKKRGGKWASFLIFGGQYGRKETE